MAFAVEKESVPIFAAHLAPNGVAVMDMAFASRNSFTNTEKLVIQQKWSNTTSSANRISFRFKILGPSGAKVFEHFGNAAPGSVGGCQSQLAGVPISQFYTGPGIYTLVVEAVLDGEISQQQATFTVSSPVITLMYPPNGSRDLADAPVIFRWAGSGASSYRITVDDDPSFYNALFTQTTLGADTSFTYPDNPPDQRQKLAGGQVYYWKVEGLDTNGNKVSESGVPFDFSVKSQATALTRDLAVLELSIVPPYTAQSQGSIPFKAAVKNQGGTSESNVELKFTLGGLQPPDSPKSVTLAPGETKDYTFAAALPSDQTQGLAIACLSFFDDNTPNNCKTIQVQSSGPPTSGTPAAAKSYSMDEAWEVLKKALGSGDIEQALQGYKLTDISGQPASEVNQMLQNVSQGTAKVTAPGKPEAFSSAPPPSTATGGSSGTGTASGATAGTAASGAAPIDAPEGAEETEEWAGLTNFLSPKTRRVVIRQEDTWKKFWALITQDSLPKVNFKRHMVVGVIAGTAEKATSLQIVSIEAGEDSILVRYQMTGEAAGRQNATPYHFKAVPRSDTRVSFQKTGPKGGSDNDQN